MEELAISRIRRETVFSQETNARVNKVTSAFLEYPLSVFNKNSNLKWDTAEILLSTVKCLCRHLFYAKEMSFEWNDMALVVVSVSKIDEQRHQTLRRIPLPESYRFIQKTLHERDFEKDIMQSQKEMLKRDFLIVLKTLAITCIREKIWKRRRHTVIQTTSGTNTTSLTP